MFLPDLVNELKESLETDGRHSRRESEAEEDSKAQVRAQVSGSDYNPSGSSTLSLDHSTSVFGTEWAQIIPCVLGLSLAFQTYTVSKSKYALSSLERLKKFSKEKPSLRGRRYYHIEYFLLPGDEEPNKVDMVVFPTLTKVFMDSGMKTVKPWHEGDKTWVTWTHHFNLRVTKEMLKKLNVHKINMKIWDSKEKVARKVKYYRLTNSVCTEDLSSLEVKHLVLHQRKLAEQRSYNKEEWNQDFMFGKLGKPRRGKTSHDTDTLSRIPEECQTLFRVEEGSPEPQWNSRKCMKGTLALQLRELLEKSSFESIINTTDKLKYNVKQSESVVKRKVRKAKVLAREEESETKLAVTPSQDVFSIQLSLTPLLAGWKLVMNRSQGKSPNIVDSFLTLKTKRQVMTEQQKQELNPLTIKITSVCHLPPPPVPSQELENTSVPVYCKYKFADMPVHVTNEHPHSTCVHFQDINVIFLGEMNPGDLRELLEGPPLVVEVHDRDLQAEDRAQKPLLFGEGPLDTYPNFHALVSPKDTESNPYESLNKMWNPHGVARVSLADLLLGHKYLNLAVPVLNCEPQPTNPNLDKRRKGVTRLGGPRDSTQPLPIGNYLQAHTQLKLRVDITVPLARLGSQTPEPDPMGPLFGHIIFVFESGQHVLLQPLLHDITMINTKALSLDSYPLGNIKQILPAIKVRMNIQDQGDEDVVTGFHLLDGQLHLLILEGLATQALKRLWENYQDRIPLVEQKPCALHKVLYNSQLRFRRRLYGNLESMVYQVRLFQPLTQLMKHPGLYVRNTVPKPVLQALTRIYDICYQSTRLREVINRDLLPSAAMVRILSQQFGVPISQKEFLEGEGLAIPSSSLSSLEQVPKPTFSPTKDIEAHQESYQQRQSLNRWQNQKQSHNFIQSNILSAYQTSKKPAKCVEKVVRISASSRDSVFNYSSQTLNSSVLARKQIQQEMVREPQKRFTYSQKYLSAMVDCCDPEDKRKEDLQGCHQADLTAEGFQLTGLQKTDYLFPRQLSTAYTEEWQEGALFRNKLQNVLDRGRWSWDRRHQDFELYKQPPTFLELPPIPKQKPVEGRKLKGSS